MSAQGTCIGKTYCLFSLVCLLSLTIPRGKWGESRKEEAGKVLILKMKQTQVEPKADTWSSI
jgi:hypothetical protein